MHVWPVTGRKQSMNEREFNYDAASLKKNTIGPAAL